MIKKIISSAIEKTGYRIVPIPKEYPFDPDMEKEFRDIYWKCKSYTMTSLARMYSVYKATQHIIKNNVQSDIVECGVWKGGSMMVSAFALENLNHLERKIFLYDTYEGMSKPTEKDVPALTKIDTQAEWNKSQKDNFNDWCYSSLNEVKKNLSLTGYPQDKMVFVKGKVEDTIPKIIPEKISILRLDTDWYESTYHELTHLFPRLSHGGILIIDDYGYWKGAKEAVDKYFKEQKYPAFLNRIDYTGRLVIKIS